jgi:hypothetical protein
MAASITRARPRRTGALPALAPREDMPADRVPMRFATLHMSAACMARTMRRARRAFARVPILQMKIIPKQMLNSCNTGDGNSLLLQWTDGPASRSRPVPPD